MHIILLSGGSGKRLWPLSNDVRSKQFLKVLKDDDGNPESMVQRVYRQINEVGGWDSVTVASGASQADLINLQLGEGVNIVNEPERRDTFPAIVLACSYLISEKNVGEDETVVVLPVDPYVDIDYFYKICEIGGVLQDNQTKLHDLALLGAKPTFPTEKYGYIVPDIDTQNTTYSTVKYFKEKPSTEDAKQLISQGALWNCGVFGFKLSFMLDILKDKYGIENINYNSLREEYCNLPKISFDYEVVEKAKNIAVIPYDKQWMDLGTWQTITLEMRNLAEGNVLMENSCSNTHIVNELDVPIVAMGVKDSVIVATHDGILVSAKEDTYRLKDMLSDVQKRPMYERKRWGRYKVLEDTETSLTKKLILETGKSISYQYHKSRKEIWTIIKGSGILYLDGEKKEVKEGDVIQIDIGQKHGIKATTELHIIEVQMGNNLVEEDIVRLEMNWE